MLKKLLTRLALIAGMGLALAACDKASDTSSSNTGAGGAKASGGSSEAATLTVLAGSELKDIEPMLEDIRRETGVQLKMKYVGTLDGVERLQSGEATDLAWFASNRYAMLVPEAKKRIVASERTMLTPVVLGLKSSKARALGWDDGSGSYTGATWKDISQAAEAGKFTFGMTSPASSNTGFSALLGLAAALSGKGDALEVKDIDSKSLSAFFKAQKMTAGSSGWLADAFLKNQDQVDGIINYSSVLLTLNRDPAMREKLTLIYPKDGLTTSDYPLMLVNADKRAAYDKLVAYLRGAPFQKAMAQRTLRQAINPDVAQPNPAAAIGELAFPARQEVVDAILLTFDNQVRTPPDSTFVLDTSGSMDGNNLDQLKKTMLGLSGTDSSISGRFARFRNREQIHIKPFNDRMGVTHSFDMGGSEAQSKETLDDIASYVRELYAAGGTAIYDATQAAYQEALARRERHPDRFYSIVVMTDGANMSGMSLNSFLRWYDALPADKKGIRVFTIYFAGGESSEMTKLAEATGGRSFDGDKGGLQAIFKEVRGYQ
ncbi:Mg-chelatase subunit ChlD [Bordetella ansorpii]|uniref:Mg-chelatase subunit ChlD n=1 Tax=Bordetella ansorpii TaxID=288768 RepID=A0A157P1U7_9BORD|nr:substrate-binding domain-containing protein [Bordetella ansorpii]SAI27458.1 Mg-chelatase subunit ChlD [Bordetella ansorpii]